MTDAQLMAELFRQGGLAVGFAAALIAVRVLWVRINRLVDVILEQNAATLLANQAMARELAELREDLHE